MFSAIFTVGKKLPGALSSVKSLPALSMTCRACSRIIHYDDSTEPQIPDYIINKDEDLKTRKARLVYQSRKRGMLENDLLLSTFAAEYLGAMTEEQTVLYDRMINTPSNDWDIFYWAVGHKPTPPEYENEIMEMFKKHVRNDKRMTRLRQPNLTPLG